jgi:hypothetical protein
VLPAGKSGSQERQPEHRTQSRRAQRELEDADTRPVRRRRRRRGPSRLSPGPLRVGRRSVRRRCGYRLSPHVAAIASGRARAGVRRRRSVSGRPALGRRRRRDGRPRRLGRGRRGAWGPRTARPYGATRGGATGLPGGARVRHGHRPTGDAGRGSRRRRLGRRRRTDRRQDGRRRRRRGLGRSRCGRRRGHWQRGDGPRRKHGQGVDVRLVHAHAEVDVRDLVLAHPGEAGLGDRVSLLDERTALRKQRAEMRQRDLVPVRGRDRDREPVRRHLARERHLARRGSADDVRGADGDVDAAVLPSRIRIVAEREAPEHLALDGPRPGARLMRGDQGPGERDEERRRRPSCPMREHGSSVASGSPRSQRNLRSCYRVAR